MRHSVLAIVNHNFWKDTNELLSSVAQINMKNFTENTFWAKTKEEKLEKPGLFNELTKTFAAKSSAPKQTESGDSLDKKAASKKKGKDLKIIDPKSAQNLCKCYKCFHSKSKPKGQLLFCFR